MTVIAHDLSPEPLRRLAEAGVRYGGSIDGVVRAADIVFLSLPGGKELDAVCTGSGGLLAGVRQGQAVVDLGTSPVKLTRELAAAFGARGVDYADAPVARTRQAATDGTLAIMAGASDATFVRIAPLLRTMGSDVVHCGAVGAGQIAKIMNNMVLAQTVVALAEALSIARAAGMDGARLFDALTKGSADSFALRNHGTKALLPDVFPTRAFAATYMLKDMAYALDLAREAGLTTPGAETARSLLERAIALGHGEAYWPVLIKALEKR
jgi:3-hydroxyisobutyrate dehydrogenase-like beta-hydroxyacid dehydrogenase